MNAQDYLQAIDPQQPVGTNCSYESCFTELAELVENSPSGEVLSEDKRWEQIRQKSEKILKETSKHLTVASYCAASWLFENPVQGLSQGLMLLSGLITAFWESLFPERERARINAILWYLSNTAKILQKQALPVPTAEDAQAASQAYEELKRLFAEKFPEETPPFNEMDRIVATLVASVAGAAGADAGTASATAGGSAEAADDVAELVVESKSDAATPVADPVEAAFQRAQALSTRGDTQAALQLMVAGMSGAASGRDRMRWRIRLGTLLISSSIPDEVVRVHIEEMKKAVDDFRLAEWEPELAVAALEVICKFWKKLDKSDKVGETLQQMVLLNAARAFASAQ